MHTTTHQPDPPTTTPRIIENPVSGESMQWLMTAEETAGRLARGLMTVRPGGAVPAAHVHARSEERFEVLAGTLDVVIGGERQRLHAGDRATVPAGVAHTWTNGGDDELRFVVEMEPAYSFEAFIETAFGLARDGRTNDRGMPSLLQTAVLMAEFGDDIHLARPSRRVQRALLGVLAPVGRACGLRATYPHHRAA